jgi:general secretion pathway protein K
VIQGFDLPLYRRLRPLVCALPTTDLSPLNLNTLRPDQAPLLSALTRGEISVERARGVIEDRPRGGYGSMQQFWRQDAFAGIALSERLRGQPALRSRYIRLITEVSLDDSTLAMDALLEQLGGGTIRVLRRSFGWPDTLRPDEI